MKAKKTVLLILLGLSLILGKGFSQSRVLNNDILRTLKNSSGSYTSVSISLDDYIEDNYYKHMIYNRANGSIMGYRLRIFSGSGHDASEKANQIRAKFLSRYEDINAYITYVAPDYKVYVGDCRTRSEVLKLIQEIKGDFPYAFLVSQPINVTAEN